MSRVYVYHLCMWMRFTLVQPHAFDSAEDPLIRVEFEEFPPNSPWNALGSSITHPKPSDTIKNAHVTPLKIPWIFLKWIRKTPKPHSRYNARETLQISESAPAALCYPLKNLQNTLKCLSKALEIPCNVSEATWNTLKQCLKSSDPPTPWSLLKLPETPCFETRLDPLSLPFLNSLKLSKRFKPLRY